MMTGASQPMPRALIIGGGIAGLATALCLRHFGIECQVFEQAASLGEVGAGIQMTPNAVKALRALGLEPALDEVGFRPAAIVARDLLSGRRLFEIPLGQAAERLYGAPYYLVHRADLISLLAKALTEQPITLRTRCCALEQTSRGVRAFLEGGRSIEGETLIGCDGINSAIRESMYGIQPASFTGNMCWRATVPVGDSVPKDAGGEATLWMGPSSHVVTYPIRRGQLMNIVAVHESPVWTEQTWSLEGDAEELRRKFTRVHDDLKAHLGAVEQCFKWGLFDRDPLPRWSSGRVTILGDAAHPMLPFLAQGAAMAIEDAYVLARQIAVNGRDVTAALANYEAARLPRTARVQQAARAQGHINHLRGPVRRLLRNLSFRMGQSLQRRPNAIGTNWIYEYDATLDDRSPAVAIH
jgi:salicylate hydroxylase